MYKRQAYNWSAEKKFGTAHRDGKYVNELEPTDKGVGKDNSKYEVYLLSTIQANYQVTPNFLVYAAAGAEYRDWTNTSGSSASNWRWQPTAFAGFKTTF